MSWLKRNWMYVLFAVVNLAIAAPAQAGWDDALCDLPNGGATECCKSCWFFCACEFLE